MVTYARDSAVCAASFNVCSLILLLFATISSFWTWGYGSQPSGSLGSRQLTVSYSPWIAGQAWTTFAFPCNCAGGVCLNSCVAGTQVLLWTDITAQAVCDVNSNVYQTWAGPLGYCSFPGGTPPAPNRTISAPVGTSTGSYYYSNPQNIPTGTTFSQPSTVSSMQALMIIATVACFLSIIFGCSDAGMSGSRSKALAGLGVLFGLLAWVFALASVSTWANFAYVKNTQSNPPSVYVPVWVNATTNEIGTVTIFDMYYGPGWATMLTALFVLFFANVVQCLSMRFEDRDDFPSPSKNDPIPTTAVPVAAGSVPPASTIATV